MGNFKFLIVLFVFFFTEMSLSATSQCIQPNRQEFRRFFSAQDEWIQVDTKGRVVANNPYSIFANFKNPWKSWIESDDYYIGVKKFCRRGTNKYEVLAQNGISVDVSRKGKRMQVSFLFFSFSFLPLKDAKPTF